MMIVSIPMERLGAPGHWSSTIDALMKGPDDLRPTRHRIYYVDENGTARRYHGGPIESGPMALPQRRTPHADDAHLPPGRPVGDMDVVEVCGQLFRAEFHGGDLELVLTTVPEIAGADA